MFYYIYFGQICSKINITMQVMHCGRNGLKEYRIVVLMERFAKNSDWKPKLDHIYVAMKTLIGTFLGNCNIC